MKRIAIAEGDGLWLQSHGHGDDRRFAELFAATWRACYAQTEIAPVGVAVSRHRHGLDPQADIREPSRHPTSLPADQGTGASCDPKLCHRQSHPAIGQEKRCQAALHSGRFRPNGKVGRRRLARATGTYDRSRARFRAANYKTLQRAMGPLAALDPGPGHILPSARRRRSLDVHSSRTRFGPRPSYRRGIVAQGRTCLEWPPLHSVRIRAGIARRRPVSRSGSSAVGRRN